MPEAQHRRLAAIMFTDMVGYSALAHSDEALALKLLNEHNRLLRSLWVQFGGREVKSTGDGFLVEFASAVEAVRCAVATQEAVAERNCTNPKERWVSLRICVHVGDVVYADGDLVGDGVNVAARIEPLADSGGICVSEDVVRQVRNKPGVDVRFRALGSHRLKNLASPIHVYSVELPWQTAQRSVIAVRSRRMFRIASAMTVAILAIGTCLLAWIHHSSRRTEYETSLEIDPVSLSAQIALADCLYYAKRYSEAADNWRKAIALDPAAALGHVGLAQVLYAQGRFEQSASEWRSAMRLDAGEDELHRIERAFELAGLAGCYTKTGNSRAASDNRAILERMPKADYYMEFVMACLYIDQNDATKMFSSLDRIAKHDKTGVWDILDDPMSDPYRSDSRFIKLLRETGSMAWRTNPPTPDPE